MIIIEKYLKFKNKVLFKLYLVCTYLEFLGSIIILSS